MFHSTDNLYFQRRDDGSVRILKLRSTPTMFPTVDTTFPAHEVVLDVTIENTWCSIIATTSKRGESYFDSKAQKHMWYVAKDFHNTEP